MFLISPALENLNALMLEESLGDRSGIGEYAGGKQVRAKPKLLKDTALRSVLKPLTPIGMGAAGVRPLSSAMIL